MIMRKFPNRAKKVRRAALWIAMRRLLIIWAFERRILGKSEKTATLTGAKGTVAAEDAQLVRVSRVAKRALSCLALVACVVPQRVLSRSVPWRFMFTGRVMYCSSV